MKNYAIIWDPNLPHAFPQYNQKRFELAAYGKTSLCWSLGTNQRHIKEGDRIFMLRGRKEPRGLIGYGKVTRAPYAIPRKKQPHIDIVLEYLVPFDHALTWKHLNDNYGVKSMIIRASGTELAAPIANAMLSAISRYQDIEVSGSDETSEIMDGIYEGALMQIPVNRFERSVEARMECLNKHGYSCKACHMNFEQVYGPIGKHFIHVHHIIPLHRIRKSYKIDPVKDLVPVCPNCHSMLHKKRPDPYTVEELRKFLNRK